MSEFTIERASECDIPGIVEVWKDFIDYHRELNQFHTRREDAHVNWEAFLRKMMLDDDALVLAALVDGKVVGYTIGRLKDYPLSTSTRSMGSSRTWPCCRATAAAA